MNNKIRVTVVYEYNMDSNNYDPSLINAESRLEIDKHSFRNEGFTTEEMNFTEISDKWEVIE